MKAPERSFFLFGPRGTGKSTWLRNVLKDAFIVDLLDSSLFLELSRNPSALSSLTAKLPNNSWVVIDEIQKVPALLDEVHRLLQENRHRFALCGSSARKLRREGINLLAGRAITRNMESFSFAELAGDFDTDTAIEWGLLPFVQMDHANAKDILSAYLNTYLKEEIREEGIVRKLDPFVRFLHVVGILNGQVVNSQNIARDASVPRSSVDQYFSILTDTLLGHWLPAYRPQAKVREQSHPKFYWFDSGVARASAGLLYDAVDKVWKGFSLETMIYHELRVYNETSNKHRDIFYYRTPKGQEIDFVIETAKRNQNTKQSIVCIECKLADKWDTKWHKEMLSLESSEKMSVKRMIGVYTGTRSYHYDGVDVLPVTRFLEELHAGKIF